MDDEGHRRTKPLETAHGHGPGITKNIHGTESHDRLRPGPLLGRGLGSSVFDFADLTKDCSNHVLEILIHKLLLSVAVLHANPQPASVWIIWTFRDHEPTVQKIYLFI